LTCLQLQLATAVCLLPCSTACPLLLNLLLKLHLELQLPMALVPLVHSGQHAWLPASKLAWLCHLHVLLLPVLLLLPAPAPGLLLPVPGLLLPAPGHPAARSRQG
jgi:hypothetical protein